MKRILTILTICLASFVSQSSFASAQLQWREINHEVNVPSLTDPRLTDGVEIFSKDAAIIIKTPRRIQVKVFTILGQLVSQANLNQGISELKFNSRGIYIVKVGGTTQKVAL